eukprot:9879020-Karenia_brevis.AAC.1
MLEGFRLYTSEVSDCGVIMPISMECNVREIVEDRKYWFGMRWQNFGILSVHAPTGPGQKIDQEYADMMEDLIA